MQLTPLARKIMSSLIQVSGAAIGSIDAETKITLTGGKKNPQQGRVTKKTEGGNVMFFTNTNSNAYNNMVKRRLAAEGKDPEGFVLSKLPWGERIAETPFIQHNDKLYVQVVYLQAPKAVKYFLDGVEIAKNAIQGLPSSEMSESSQGGLNNKVILRTYMLENLRKLKMGDLSVL